MPDSRERLLLLARAKAKRESEISSSEEGFQAWQREGQEYQQSRETPLPSQPSLLERNLMNPAQSVVESISNNPTWQYYAKGLVKPIDAMVGFPARVAYGGGNTVSEGASQIGQGQVETGALNIASGLGQIPLALRMMNPAGLGFNAVMDALPSQVQQGVGNVLSPTRSLTDPQTPEGQARAGVMDTYLQNILLQRGANRGQGETYSNATTDPSRPYQQSQLPTYERVGPPRGMPEQVMSAAGGFKGLSDGEATAYAVKNRIPMGTSFKEAPINFDLAMKRIRHKVENEITPELEKMDKAGEKFNRWKTVDDVVAELENDPEIEAPSGSVKTEVIQKIAKAYRERGEWMKPTDMQKEKTATHIVRDYGDFASNIGAEFDKGLARRFKDQLEVWSPKLETINKDLGSEIKIRDRIFGIAEKQGQKLPAGESSLPFYVAVSDIGRGTGLAIARNMMTARVLSQASFGLDALRSVVKKRPAEPNLPGYEPPKYDPARTLPPSPILTPLPTDVGGLQPFQQPYVHYGIPSETPLLPPKSEGVVSPPASSQAIWRDGYRIDFRGRNSSNGLPVFQDTKTSGSFTLEPGETFDQALQRHRATIDAGLAWRNSPEGREFYRTDNFK